MKHLVALVFCAWGSLAHTDTSDTIVVEFSRGDGFMLCADTPKLPPLEAAFDCPSAIPILQNEKVILTKQKTAKPEWYLYSGTYHGTIDYKKFHVTYELLLSLTSADGQKNAYVEGRMIDNVTRKPIYFRSTAEESFANLTVTTIYGPPIPYLINKEKDAFIPLISFASVDKTQPLSARRSSR